MGRLVALATTQHRQQLASLDTLVRRVMREARHQLTLADRHAVGIGERLSPRRLQRDLHRERQQLTALEQRLTRSSRRCLVRARQEQARRSPERLAASGLRRLTHHQRELHALQRRSHAVDPERVIERGYAIVTNRNGKRVRRVSQVAVGEAVTIRLSDGRITVKREEREDG